MKKAKIFYFTLQDTQTKEEKLEWFANKKFEEIPFDHIIPDQKENWINLTDNDFDELLPLIDKEVKAGKSQLAIFQLFSRGVATQRDEWVYDFSWDALSEKMKYFVEVYKERLQQGKKRDLDIKWDQDLTVYLKREISKVFEESKIVKSLYRPYTKQYLYFDKHFNGRTYQLQNIFPNSNSENSLIWVKVGSEVPFFCLTTNCIPDLLPQGGSQCFPLYRYDENGNRIDNITDWGLEQFCRHYQPSPPQPPSPTGEGGVGGSQGFNSSTIHLFSSSERGAEDADLSVLVGAKRNIPEELLQRARDLRRRQTPAEKILWECLRANRLFGFKFRRQHNIGQYIADFYCHAAKLVIELDGEIHLAQKDRDHDRDSWLQANSLIVLRFTNNEIAQNLEQVLQTIASHLPSSDLPSPVGDAKEVKTIPSHLPSSDLPSPVGEGQEVKTIPSHLPSSDLPSPVGEGQGVRAITKLDIFHYTYAVLHHPAYQKKYELNLKREFPRLPFYDNFFQWVEWGKQLMDLHLNYETIEPYGLTRTDVNSNKQPKVKLKADKEKGLIDLDGITCLEDIPASAWDYKLGNRSALEWILDQYKEKKPKDPTIAKLFNTYRFADYKEHVIDLLQRVCTVSVKTMEIIGQMPDE